MRTYTLLERLYADATEGAAPGPGFRRHTREIALFAQQSLETWKPRGNDDRWPFVFQVIDLFCGCGGMSLGFAALSRNQPFFKIVGGCDIAADVVETFRRNFGATASVKDVRVLARSEKALDAFLSDLEVFDPRKPLVLIGCAPCQGFTSHRKKRWDETDRRNSLVEAFARLAVRLNPVCVVMENVPEMLSAKYWDHFARVTDTLRRAGYVVQQAIYNAAEFGVPQERFRALVMAMKRDFVLPSPFLEPARYVTVRQAIGHLPPVAPGEQHPDDPLHRCARHRKTTLRTIRAVPKDGGSRPPGVGPKCLDRVKGFYDVYGRLHWDRAAITITHYARNPASGRFVHPTQDRGLTMREAALLQSFPVGFELVGSFDSVFSQIGEAVAPKFACAVAATVLVELLSSPPTPEEKTPIVQPITEPVNNSYSSLIAGLKMARHR